MNFNKIFSILIVLLIILNLGLSSYLIYESQTFGELCIAGQGCDFVQSSSYSYLFGVKLTYISLIAFVLLLVLFFFSKKLFYIATIIGAIAAIYFISLQIFLLKSICSTCVIIDSIAILIAILATIDYLINRKKKV